MKTPFTRRTFFKTSAVAPGASMAAPLWQSRLFAAVESAPKAFPPPPIPPGPLVARCDSLIAYAVPQSV